jgi:hypothetical protein
MKTFRKEKVKKGKMMKKKTYSTPFPLRKEGA